jgi:endoglycosylceramidase
VQHYPATEEGAREAASNFWTNTTLQYHLSQVWGEIARRYANETAIAGYDVFNEPWAVGQSLVPHFNATNVEKFYLNVVASIRAVDSKHIVFLEPPKIMAFTLPLNDRKIVYSPHFYPLSFSAKYFPENVTVLEADLAAKYRKFVVESGRPMWIGEFGAFMNDDSYRAWLDDAVKLFNRYEVGWAWWPLGNGAAFPSYPFTFA